ncbi:hypothetical protein ACFZAR_24045 [Streptomyces sp. NPDC008222]|uniref:hypothetical protein n=1 Tax=Streptomyces sp. NPDC008222 TaxID=3364820 RepID=UPI0036E61285
MKAVRILTGLAGAVLMGVGVSLLPDAGDPTGVLLWLGGALLLHDAVIAPLVLVVGLLLVRSGGRGPVRGALMVAGALTAVALPVLLRPGTPANSSVLPLDYPRNWLLALVAVATVTALLTAGRGFVRGRRPRLRGVRPEGRREALQEARPEDRRQGRDGEPPGGSSSTSEGLTNP